MIIYSVTVSVISDIEADWLDWMQRRHIPDVMATACFQKYALTRLLEPQPEPDMRTFNIQYHCESLEAYETYQRMYAPALQTEHNRRYPEQFVAFRTLLEQILPL